MTEATIAAAPQPEAAFLTYQNTRFFASLDGVRFFCIALVIWLHSPLYQVIRDDMPRFLQRGHTGVDFFFVLSGFLITTLLLREENKKGQFSLSGFYYRRILRIFPAYFLLLFACILFFVVLKAENQYLPMIPYYLFFLANMLKGDIPMLGPTWSLAVEEQFYLLWPLILLVLAGMTRLRAGLLVVLIAGCVIAGHGWFKAWGLGPIETEHAIWAVHTRGFSAILTGALLALLLQYRRSFLVLWSLAGYRWAPAVLAVILLLFYQFLPGDLSGWPYTSLHIIMALLLASIVMREDHVARPLLTFPPIRRIGQISYGLYLYHIVSLSIATIIMRKLTGAMAAPLTTTLLMILLGLVMAELSFRYYESYFLNLRHRSKP